MSDEKQSQAGEWIKCKDRLPPNGDYAVLVVNNGQESVTTRRMIGNRWFGGCRPFTDGEVVIQWLDNE